MPRFRGNPFHRVLPQTAPNENLSRRRFLLSLGALASEGAALDLYDRGRAAGYQFKIVPHRTSEGPYQYELRLGQILTEREARLLADRLARDLNVAVPTVLRR